MLPLSLISLPFFLLPWLSLAQDPIHIGLQRRIPRSFNYAREAERLRVRYGHASPNTMGRRETSSIPIINQDHDTSYLATVNVGTPPQQLSVVLDSGSTDFWVATTDCTACQGTKLFNSTKSSSFKSSASQVTISYGSGQVAGTIGQDTLSMGGFTLQNQTLLNVAEVDENLISGEVSGIMGLAWTSLATTRADPFWYRLAIGDYLTTPDMSFWLKRQIGSSVSLTDGGIFTLGGINTTLYTGEIEFIRIPVQPLSFWLLSLSSLRLNGSPISVKTGSSVLAAIDTGTTLIGGPSEDVDTFWNAVPGASKSQSASEAGFYTFPCKTEIDVAMAFGGKSWSINSVDMNLGQTARGSSRCVGAIFDLTAGSAIPPGGANPSWVVGATFLKNVYTVFQASPVASIGFAQLSSAAGGSLGAGVVDSSTDTFTKTRSAFDPTNTAPNSNSTSSSSSSSSILSASVVGIIISLVPSLLNVVL